MITANVAFMMTLSCDAASAGRALSGSSRLIHVGGGIPYTAPCGVSDPPSRNALEFQNRGYGAEIPHPARLPHRRYESGQGAPHATQLAIGAAIH
jgi:hypothetical protein